MARKKTALEIALGTGNARGFDVRRAALAVASGVMLVVGLLCLAQAALVAREIEGGRALEDERQQIAATLAEHVRAQQARLARALDDPEIRLALATLDDTARQRATVRLRERMPAVEHVEWYAADLPELLTADLAAFGYARADILADARDRGGAARAQAHRNAQRAWRLALAQAVREGDRTLAWAYVLLPADELLSPIERGAAAGAMSLRQGEGDATIASRDRGASFGEERVAEVEGSIFRVTSARVAGFKPSDVIGAFATERPFAMGLFGLLLLLAGMGLALLRRRHAAAGGDATLLSTLTSMLRRRPAGAATAPPPDEPMMPALAKATTPAPAAAAKPAPKPAAAVEPTTIDRSIFRAYDIRGIVGKSLTDATARAIGQAIGTVLRERGLREICVGRDGRLSGPQLTGELIKGLRAAGADVIDIGAVPTPTLYFATYHLNTGSGVMVTGSHNPPDYNGFKIVVGGETLAEDRIADLYARIVEGRLATGAGGLQQIDVSGDYVDRITGDVQIERALRVVVDAGNGIAGELGPRVLEGIGCEVLPLYCDVDGTFPNHHPDPGDPENLQDLITSVKRLKADLGIAFDGDGDRLGVVTADGEVIYPDRLLMLFAIDVLNRNPGATIIYDVKCTGHLQDVVLRHGGSPLMWKTGHSLIKAKMREDDAELAGEMSGHFFFRERWFGFDDGIYAAARLCEILGASDRKPQEVFDELPKGVSTPELKVPMEEGAHYAFVAKFRERASFPGARVSTIDGVRADYPDGWGLVRCSNTTPVLVLRFDADTQPALERIQATFRDQLLALEPSLKLPF